MESLEKLGKSNLRRKQEKRGLRCRKWVAHYFYRSGSGELLWFESEPLNEDEMLIAKYAHSKNTLNVETVVVYKRTEAPTEYVTARKVIFPSQMVDQNYPAKAA